MFPVLISPERTLPSRWCLTSYQSVFSWYNPGKGISLQHLPPASVSHQPPTDGLSRSVHYHITVVDQSTILSVFKLTDPETGEEDSSGALKLPALWKRLDVWFPESPSAVQGILFSESAACVCFFTINKHLPSAADFVCAVETSLLSPLVHQEFPAFCFFNWQRR